MDFVKKKVSTYLSLEVDSRTSKSLSFPFFIIDSSTTSTRINNQASTKVWPTFAMFVTEIFDSGCRENLAQFGLLSCVT